MLGNMRVGAACATHVTHRDRVLGTGSDPPRQVQEEVRGGAVFFLDFFSIFFSNVLSTTTPTLSIQMPFSRTSTTAPHLGVVAGGGFVTNALAI